FPVRDRTDASRPPRAARRSAPPARPASRSSHPVSGVSARGFQSTWRAPLTGRGAWARSERGGATVAEDRAGARGGGGGSGGSVPGAHPQPDWQPGSVVERQPDGMYRVRLDAPIAGRTAEKDALPEHIRPLADG